MSIEKNIGGLYQMKFSINFNKSDPPRFCSVENGKIDNEKDWDHLVPIFGSDILILIKDMKFSRSTVCSSNKNTFSFDGSFASISSTLTLMDADNSEFHKNWCKDYDLVKKQWEDNGHMKGSVFLTPNGSQVWMSDVDFKYFEEVEI